MKKFMKVCAIMALIFGVVGCVLGTLGSRVTGRTAFGEIMENLTGGRIRLKSMGWWDMWGFNPDSDVALKELDEIDFGEPDYDISEDTIFDRDRDILKGDVDKYCPGENIRRLDIELGGCRLETRDSEDGAIYLETAGVQKFQGYAEDGTLYIKASAGAVVNWREMGSNWITLYLPDGYTFEEVEAEVGAGSLDFVDLNAAEVSLHAGAGSILAQHGEIGELKISVGVGAVEIYSMKIRELEAEVGMGAFVLDADILDHADVECSMGNVEMTLAGRETDFDYHLEGSMGNIDLGSESMYRLNQERDISNNASKQMDIECFMGNITISFTE